MASYNKVILMGNLTREPELRYTSNGTAVCSFGLAVNSKYKSVDEWKNDTCFVDITCWNKQAESCNEYLSKGSAVMVDGRLNFSTWETDGQKRSKLDVVAQTVQFLPKAEKSQSKPNNQGASFEEVPGISDDNEIPF